MIWSWSNVLCRVRYQRIERISIGSLRLLALVGSVFHTSPKSQLLERAEKCRLPQTASDE